MNQNSDDRPEDRGDSFDDLFGPRSDEVGDADVEHTLQLPTHEGRERPAETPLVPPSSAAPSQTPPSYTPPTQHAPQSQQPQPQHAAYQQQGPGPTLGQHAAPGQQGPGTGQPGPWAPPGYQPPGRPPQPPRSDRSRVPGWVWPVVCSLALLIGLVGGAIGGVVAQEYRDNNGDGTSSQGLDGVDTVSTPPLKADNGSIAAVAQKLLPSTVQIIAEFKSEQGNGATGSGFVLDKQGHFITNNHVVAEADENGKIEVVDHTGKHFDAKVVGRSPVYDIAVLYAEDAKGMTPASLGSSKNLQVGDGVVAIGSPLGLSSTVTSGIVSALNRPVTTGDSGDDASYINAVQTDAAINPGNSGGPLTNMRGQVVGVNSAIATTGGGIGGESGNIGVGFSIPIEQVRITADQILKNGKSQYPVIGAKVATGGESTGEGAEIDEVVKGTPADKAGLKKGDVVTEIDGENVTDGIALIVAIRTHQPGEKIKLTVDRGGDEKSFDVTLGAEEG